MMFSATATANLSTTWTNNGTTLPLLLRESSVAAVAFSVKENNSAVWQSFDHPTDCLLPGQNLFQGQKLKSSVSLTNSTDQEGMFSLQITDKGLFAYVESNPPQAYYSRPDVYGDNTYKGRRYMRFLNGVLNLCVESSEQPYDWIDISPASSAQYMKLMPDGHLQVFEWTPESVQWTVISDPLTNSFVAGECGYPLNVTLPPPSHQVARVVGATIGSFVILLAVAIGLTMYVVHMRKRDDELEEGYLDQVPGMPNRFSYEELKIATANFSKKLGEGGYGSVFEGTLGDGTKIAVKCLEGLAHVKKSFLAEVQSIGSIHHVNLVRLRGFSTWKSQWFLVKNFDRSQPEENWHLLRVFEKCWEQETLLDIVDMNSEDMHICGSEVVEMMNVASWCLQTDYTRRPSMSSVVKALEGGTNVDSNLDYNFTDPRLQKNNSQEKDLTPLLPSVLSGPR
ncbi:hypothetical protein L1987_61579 [Smallanthus sonchifolius]|uniref:Uncharacterized protein n=1 Tax=Smallanthus sonchifolius TaxID=185202 RepID=A0ACB9C800_9ASTR|nr:hypothetical protein L1987_61579 [Smallanthus sonchifolius]